MWPFELLSVLLLVALIGAFAVSRVVLHRGHVDADDAPDAARARAAGPGAAS